MKRSPLVVGAFVRTLMLAMTAFTLVIAVRVLGEPYRAARPRLVEQVTVEELEADLPPGHPPLRSCPVLPPGHPPVGASRLPPGHPPVDGEAHDFPVFRQDGTSTL